MSTPLTESAPEPAASARRLSPQTTTIIAVLLAAAFVVILNETILAVALRDMAHDLGVSEVTGQWLSTVFMLTMAVVIPISGFVIQGVPPRTVFLTAMGLFILGTVVAAFGPPFGLVLVARIVQAAGTAVMMPLLMTTILNLVAVEHRGMVMGNAMLAISVAPALGPFVSGLVLQFLDWPWIFRLVLPVAVLIAALGWRFLPNFGEPTPAAIDVGSVILSVIGFGLLVWGLSELGVPTANHLLAAGALVVAVVALVVFAVRQRSLRHRHDAGDPKGPLLDLEIVRFRNFAVGLVIMAVAFMGLMGTALILPLFLQGPRGVMPVVTGMIMLPGGIAMGALGPVIGRAYDRIGPRPLAVPGALLVAVVLAVMGLVLSATTPVWLIVVLHVSLSLGLALLFTPVFTAALGVLSPELYSHGSAGLGALQQVASAAGTAAMFSVMAATTAGLARGGSDAGDAQLGGMRAAFLVAAAAMVIALAATTLLRRPPATDGAPAAH